MNYPESLVGIRVVLMLSSILYRMIFIEDTLWPGYGISCRLFLLTIPTNYILTLRSYSCLSTYDLSSLTIGMKRAST